jgi:hypothetical protein
LTDYDLFSSHLRRIFLFFSRLYARADSFVDMSQYPSVSELYAILRRQSVTFWNDLAAVMNFIEHQRMRLIVLRPGGDSISNFGTYIHSIVQWKDFLLYLAPELREVVGVLEKLEMQFLAGVFRKFEDAQSLDKRALIFILIVIFEDVQRLGSTQRLDAALADQLQLAIKSRLQVFCTSVFDFHPPKKPGKKLKNLWMAQMIDYNKELSCCMPPHYREFSYAYSLRLEPEGEALRHLDPNSLDSTSCLVSRSNSTDRHHDTNRCCCGWISDIIPTGISNWFGFSSKTFLRYFHSESVIHIGIVVLPAPEIAHSIMNKMSGIWHLDNVSLLYKMTIFYLSFRTCLRFAIKHSQKFHDLTTTTLLQDQLLAQARGHRELLFFTVLEQASEIMHAFFTSRGEGYTDTKGIMMALFELNEWGNSQPSEFMKALHGTTAIMKAILWLKKGSEISDLT